MSLTAESRMTPAAQLNAAVPCPGLQSDRHHYSPAAIRESDGEGVPAERVDLAPRRRSERLAVRS